MPIQVNITTKVNSKAIRRETHNGRPHFVIPSYTLPFNVVMNRIMYPRDEILRTYKSLDGTLAPLGHPTVNGKFVSAFSPEGINVGHAGAWNRNAKVEGNRIYIEKWLDVEVAKNSAQGKKLLERLEAIERGEDVPPIHTSVAAFIDRMEAPKGAEFEAIAKINSFDHDAILLDEVGAATPEQGVGLMVNADEATPISVNAGALAGESYRDREKRLDEAARARFVQSGSQDYVWIADFTDSQAVIIRNGGVSELYGYKIEAGRIVFDDAGVPVERQESWVARIPVLNHLRNFFTNLQARPASTMEGDMPLTKEEKAELVDEIGKSFAANVATAIKEGVAEQVKPLVEKIGAIEANQETITKSLQANAAKELAEKREAVAKVHGEVVANALEGEALDAMYEKCKKAKAAPVVNGALGEGGDEGKPSIPDWKQQLPEVQ